MTCSICYQKLNDYISCNTCSYKFNKNCLIKWTEISGNLTCPICRSSLNEKILNQLKIKKYLNDCFNYQHLEIQGYYNTNYFDDNISIYNYPLKQMYYLLTLFLYFITMITIISVIFIIIS